MSDTDALARRVEDLEAALAYQEMTLDDLNRVILDQWKRIDDLTRRVAGLSDQLRETESRLGAPGAPEPPPPHY